VKASEEIDTLRMFELCYTSGFKFNDTVVQDLDSRVRCVKEVQQQVQAARNFCCMIELENCYKLALKKLNIRKVVISKYISWVRKYTLFCRI
jgi:hypothetical protein